MNVFLESLKKRRSQYMLGKDVSLSDEQLEKYIGDIIQTLPSAMNSQSQRAVLLFGKNHDKLWDIVLDALKALNPDNEVTMETNTKINGFKNAYATVLFYADQDVTDELIRKFPTYKDNFVKWQDHENGIMQLAVWTGLAEENIGASLQHYNPLIDEKVREEFGIPESWKLNAQMPFGNIITPMDENPRDELSTKFKVFI